MVSRISPFPSWLIGRKKIGNSEQILKGQYIFFKMAKYIQDQILLVLNEQRYEEVLRYHMNENMTDSFKYHIKKWIKG
ncbi:hypothetical protein C2H98_05385 [Niallia circulans]|nr:hypothetical protein C2H98_05385 [Niallia circulans]